MRLFFFILVIGHYCPLCSGQVVLFSESFGTASGTVSLDQHALVEGFDYDNLEYADGDAANATDIRVSSPSSSYTQENGEVASGGCNVWFSSSGERGFSVSGIPARSFDSLTLWFAYRKESASSNAQFRIEWSVDGNHWDSLTVSGLPADAAATGWYFVGPIALPGGAHENDLSLRWIKTSGAMRLDDILLMGSLNRPFITASEYELDGFAANEDLGNASSLTIEITALGLTVGDTLYFEADSFFELRADSANFQAALSIVSDSETMVIVLFCRLTANQQRGNPSSNLMIRTPGADTLIVPLTGVVYYAGEYAVLWSLQTDSADEESEGIGRPVIYQNNNHGSTTFLSASSPSDNYAEASAGNNGAIAVKSGTLDTATGSYLSWAMEPPAGKDLCLLELAFGARATSTGPQQYSLRSSHDSFQSELAGGSLDATSTWNYYRDVAENVEVDVSTEFRLYLYGGSGTAPMNIANFRIDDLELRYRIWNQKTAAVFRTNRSGAFSDSSLWEYEYVDSLFREAEQIPGASNSVIIAAADTVALVSSVQTEADWTVDGVLDMQGFSMELGGALNVEGYVEGHPSSSLTFNGTDPNSLRMSANSPYLGGLTLQSDSGLTLLDTLCILNWVGVQQGTIYSNGFLKLCATDSSYAQVLPKGQGNIAGSMCMQMRLNGTAGWRAFFSPLDTATLGQLGGQLEIHTSNTAGSGDNRNVYTWDEAQSTWEIVDDPEFPLRGQALNIYFFESEEGTLEICGLYDTNAVSFGALGFHAGAAESEGWHLLGNPYPSGISWNSIEKPSGINGNYAIWSEADGNYRVWNGSSGSAGDLIPPMHGFWVKTNSAMNSPFVVANCDRDTGQITHFGKKPSVDWEIRIRVESLAGQYRDECILFGTAGENGVIAQKLEGKKEAPYLALASGKGKWSLFSPKPGDRIVPIHFRAAESGTYTFLIECLDAADWDLLDEKTGNVTALSGNKNYSFPYAEGESSTGRFFLVHKTTSLETAGTIQFPLTVNQSQEGLSVLSEGATLRGLQLFSLNGQRLLQAENLMPLKEMSLSTGGLAPGLYLLYVETENGTQARLILQH